MAPLSGVYASLGTNKLNGIKMLFGEKNNQVEGARFELIIEDTEAKPQEGLRKARKLVEQDNVDVLLGVISSAVGYALKEYVARAKKVWVTTGAAADGIFKKANNTPYAFRASLSPGRRTTRWEPGLAEKGFKRVFVTGPDYAMGREAMDAFERTFKVKGATAGRRSVRAARHQRLRALSRRDQARQPGSRLCLLCGQRRGAVRPAIRRVRAEELDPARRAMAISSRRIPFAAQGDAAEGIHSGLNWAYGLDTPLNKAFVASIATIQEHTDGRFGRRLCRRAGGLGGASRAWAARCRARRR